jgi:site-specific DNA-methyltransferase (adenine-specific)
MQNRLYYGDNLEVLRKHIRDETVDLCYIDPPFNSKRNYNQIYNNIGGEDRAQAQAFTDTWLWDEHANECFNEILLNANGVQTQQSIELISGLDKVLGRGSLFAYLVSMTARIAEIHRTLKTTGSFYLHCDPTASHYLKLVCDALFVTRGGDFRNEIYWYYYNKMHDSRKKLFPRATDTLLFYVKNIESDFTYYQLQEKRDQPVKQLKRKKVDGVMVNARDEDGSLMYQIKEDRTLDNVWRLPCLQPAAPERLGYPTQKPEALLERIISASSNEGDVVLDSFCGCGTTVAVAQRLKRQWIGMDITYQSIALVLRRLEKTFGKEVLDAISLNGIPQDMKSAVALANKKDDRLRKEFEKWAVLTYTNNRAIINDKKGADKGIDGVAYFMTGKADNAKIIFQVKSGGVKRNDVATLRGDMEREHAALAVLITLEKPSKPMVEEAKAAGLFNHEQMGRSYDRIQIVTAEEIVEQHKRLDIPMSLEVLKDARRDVEDTQLKLHL